MEVIETSWEIGGVQCTMVQLLDPTEIDDRLLDIHSSAGPETLIGFIHISPECVELV